MGRPDTVMQYQAVVESISPGRVITNTAFGEWSSLPLDYENPPNAPQSPYNPDSSERIYDPPETAPLTDIGPSASVSRSASPLPDTGFAPGEITHIGPQPVEKAFAELGALWIEIPKLGAQLPIVSVPLTEDGWDVTWLFNQAGYLEGTAFPTWAGNTVITAHIWDAYDNPGPFTQLKTLQHGDKVYIHAWGQVYTYEVRSNYLTSPGSQSSLRHEEYDWVTLLTCERFNKRNRGYTYRLVVKAVLVSIGPDT